MNTLEIRDVARDLRKAAAFYLEDAFKDRLSGLIRKWFEESLVTRKMSSIIEIAEPAMVFASKADGTELIVMIGEKEYKITRVIGLHHLSDVDDIRARTDEFLAEVKAAIVTYVQNLPVDVAIATIPSFLVDVKAYTVKWFLWGYVGVLKNST